MAHYLGKKANAPISRQSLGLNVADINELYQGPTASSSRTLPIRRGATPYAPSGGRTLPYRGEPTPYTPGQGEGPREIPPGLRPPEDIGEGEESYVDELMTSLFGEGFENIRGIGGRSQEAVYDLLARQGLLGTGAATDVGKEMAWQTERGITDLIREMAKMRAGKEKEAMDMIMTWLGMTSGAWG